MKKRIITKILTIILIICIFLCIALTNGSHRKVSNAESILTSIVYIPQKALEKLYNLVTNNQTFFDDLEKLKSENSKLKEENKNLKIKIADYDILKEQNNKYKSNQELKSLYKEYKVAMADIVSISNNNWDKTFTINKGSNDGIKPKMAVITSDGLVGYISSCTDVTSKVVSIIDATSSISARAADTREEVIIKGTNYAEDDNLCTVTDIPLKKEFKSGDVFVTSGMGGFYPKGIKIGEITKFYKKENPFENFAELKTSVDFNRLETVAIIIDN